MLSTISLLRGIGNDILWQTVQLSPLNSLPQLSINRHDLITAAGPHIIASPPFEHRYKEQAQTGIYDIHLQVPVPPAVSADHQLVKIQLFPSLIDPHNKKHASKLLSSGSFYYNAYQGTGQYKLHRTD